MGELSKLSDSKLSSKYSNPRVKWGGWSSLGMGFLAWLIPQIVLGVMIAVVAVSRDIEPTQFLDSDNFTLNFLFGAFISVFSVGIVWRYISKRGGLKALGFTGFEWRYFKHVFAAYGVYFVSFIAAILLVSTIAPTVDLDQEQELIFDNPIGIEIVYTFVALVILPPLYEEILFRGFAFQGFAKAYGFLPAALVVNGLFGLAHGQINVAIDTFILGFIASWLVWRTKSLWPAILLHGVKNLIAFVIRFIV